MKRFLVSPNQLASVYEAADWLNSLIGSDYKGCVITDVLSWQIVREGSYFKAVAMVQMEERE